MKERLVDPQKLYDEGWDLLEEENFEQAMEVGKRLERLRWSGAFELQAAVYEAEGDLEGAVSVLRKGVDKTGGNYSLSSRLGNTLSDLGHYEEAIEAYEVGMALETTDITLFRMNLGLVYSRMDQNEKALSEYKAIESDISERGMSESIFWHYKGCVARALSDLGKASELAELIEPIRKDLLDNDDFEASKSRISAAYAVSLWHLSQEAASNRWLTRAIELDRNGWQCKWLTREKLLKSQSIGGKLYYITGDGVWPAYLTEDNKEWGALACFEVVADDEQQAFEFSKSFIHELARNSFMLDEFEILESEIEEPKGVYKVNPYILYDLEGDEED